MSAAASVARQNYDEFWREAEAAHLRLASIPVEQINAAIPVADPADKYDCVQDRTGEEQRGIAETYALQAIYTSPWFWKAAAKLPRNNLKVLHGGRPQDYPDWFLFLMEQVAATTRTASRQSASVVFRDKARWQEFVLDVNSLVPKGWTRLAEIDHSKKKERKRSTMARPMTAWSDDVIPLRRRDRRVRMRALKVLPPEPHHSDYFAQKWRGLDKKGYLLPEGHPWKSIRRDVMSTFTKGAIQQIRAMGGLNPAKDFAYLHADRDQYIGWDGVVFPMSRHRKSTAIGLHVVGGDTARRVRGSKFTVGSARIAGQYMSRVIFALLHTGSDPDSQAATEQEAVLKITPLVGALTRKKIKGKVKQGLKGVLVDSVVRGQDLVRLQRLGYIVVNYPHAMFNPDGGPGKRLNPTRVEKSHLRTIARHKDEHGHECKHHV